jgi:RNA ligase
MNPDQYFKIHDLWDLDKLKQHCEHNLVRVITSPRFPGIIMLHYTEAAQWDKAWNTFNRMCRGLIVHLPTQKVLAYPLNKFHNLDEVPETDYEVLKDKKDFEVSEKLDGSMLIRFCDPNTGKYHLTTKGSLDSEHGLYATELMGDRFQESWLEPYTLMFELISKKFQIVIDYPKKGYPEGLYLIGVRQHWSNKLFTYNEVQSMAEALKIPTVKTYEFESLDKLIEKAKELPFTEEGYVIRFQDGLRVKLKGTAYLRAHRFISHLSDRNLLEACSEGVDKTLIEVCPEELREEVSGKISYYKKRATELTNTCYNLFNEAPKGSRKEFALWTIKNCDPYLKGFLFHLFDGKEVNRKMMFETIGKMENISGQTKI